MDLGPINWLTPLGAVERITRNSRELKAAKASILERMELEQCVESTIGLPPGGRSPMEDLRDELAVVMSQACRTAIQSAADGELIGFGHTSPGDREQTIIPSHQWHFLKLNFGTARAQGDSLDYAGVRFLVLKDLTPAQQGGILLLLEKASQPSELEHNGGEPLGPEAPATSVATHARQQGVTERRKCLEEFRDLVYAAHRYGGYQWAITPDKCPLHKENVRDLFFQRSKAVNRVSADQFDKDLKAIAWRFKSGNKNKNLRKLKADIAKYESRN